MVRARYVLIAAAALLGLVLTVAYLAVPVVIGHLVRSELARRGIVDSTLSVGLPKPHRLTIGDVRLGRDGAFTAAGIRVEYTLRDLVSGRVDRILLIRPVLHLQLQNGRVSMGSLDPLLASGPAGTSGAIALPAPIAIKDGRIFLETPGGQVATTLNGTLSAVPGSGPLVMRLASPWGEAVLEVSLNQRPEGFAVQGRVLEGKVAHRAAAIASVAGTVNAVLGGRPAATAELRVVGLGSPFLAVGATPAEGTLKAQIRNGMLDARLDLASADGALTLTLTGAPPQPLRLAATGHGLAVPGWIEAMEMTAAADFDPGQALLTTTDTARISGRPAPALLDMLPQPARTAVAGSPVVMTLDPRFVLTRNADAIRASGRAAVSAAGGALRLTAQGDIAFALDGTFFGTVDTLAEADRLEIAAARLTRARAMATLRIATGTSLALGLTAPAIVTADAADLGQAHFDRPKLTLQAPVAGQPVLVWQAGSGEIALAAGSAAWSGTIARDTPVEVGWTEVVLEGPLANPAARAAGGRVTLPKAGWTAEGIDLRYQPAGADAPPQIALAVAALRDTAKIPLVAPLRLEGVIRPAADALAFDVHAQDMQGRLKLRIEGSHRYDRAAGMAKVASEPLHFAANGLQPVDLFPALGNNVRDAEGDLGLAGTLSWSPKGLTSDLKLSLSQLRLTAPFAKITGLDGTIRIDRLMPLSTPAGQRLTAAAIDAGLPLTDAALQFRLRDGRFLDLEDGRLHLAGGTVMVKPVTFDRAAARNAATIDVAAVDLAPLFALLGFDGLVGTGTLSGHVPVALVGDDLEIAQGVLAADGPGQIRYDPKEAPAALQGGSQSVGLALAALRNFHYDRLALTIDRALGGDTMLALHVAGKNPDFYGGYPVEFNLSLNGKLDRILFQGLTGYRIPEILQKRLEAQPKAGAPVQQ